MASMSGHVSEHRHRDASGVSLRLSQSGVQKEEVHGVGNFCATVAIRTWFRRSKVGNLFVGLVLAICLGLAAYFTRVGTLLSVSPG